MGAGGGRKTHTKALVLSQTSLPVSLLKMAPAKPAVKQIKQRAATSPKLNNIPST